MFPCSAAGQTHAPGLSTQPPVQVTAVPSTLRSFHRDSGDLGAQQLSQANVCLAEVGTPLLDMSHGRMARGSIPEPTSGLCHGFLDGHGVSSSVLGTARPCLGH